MSLNQFPRRSFSGAATLQTFTGNGSTTTYTLSQAQFQNESFVFVDDVAQVPGVDFTINGTTLTFTSAPANNAEIIVRGFGVPTPLNVVSDASVTTAKVADGAITHSKLHTTAIQDKLGYTPVSPTQLSTEVANLVASAPSTLNTLNELALALGNDANFATTVTNSLASKATSADITPTAVSDKVNSSTGYFDLPSGTTAQRPGTPATGMCRFNTTTNYYEFYDGSSWVNLSLPYNVDYLAIAGGGSGGNGFSNTTGTTGGGGAGGYITGTAVTISPGQTYTITIGGGAAGVQQSSGSSTFGNNGNNTTISGLAISATAIAGGRGGFDSNSGGSGGSGGGGGSANASGGSGTSGQGFAGSNGGSPAGGGGGGGAGSTGGTPTNSGGGGTSGNGGSGLAWLDGVTRAGGGGGGGAFNSAPITPGAGGSGGGTAGGVARSSGGTAGGPGVGTISSNNATANTGSGSGGGGSQDATGAASGSGNGGSGVVIIRYSGVQRATGGTITSSGGYTYHTFTSSGTFTA